MSDWKTTPQDMPIPLTNCWVRLNYWFGAPFLAQWDSVQDGWIDIVNSKFYPIWSISRWKYE